jgi:putative glutamine amidotransferase
MAAMTTPSRPVVLVSTASTSRDRGLRRQDAVTGRNYSQALLAEGALPLMAANLDPAAAHDFMLRADGLLLSGGADVDPAAYGRAPRPGLGVVDQERDAFEVALYRAARALGRPVFGICRGIQLINVAEGGTLHQHVPDLPHAIQHEQASIDGRPHHRIDLLHGSLAARAADAPAVMTNTYHHQAIDDLAPTLRATGHSEDGLVEVAEGTEGGWLLAVQWHPEMSYASYPAGRWPFRAFVQALVPGPEPARAPGGAAPASW